MCITACSVFAFYYLTQLIRPVKKTHSILMITRQQSGMKGTVMKGPKTCAQPTAREMDDCGVEGH